LQPRDGNSAGWKTLLPTKPGGLAEEDLVMDGWTDLSRRIRDRIQSLPEAARTPANMMAAWEESDFQKMNDIRRRVDDVVHDATTADALKAWYRQLCKRPCFHDDYLEAFNQPGTQLIDTDGQGVEQITEKGFDLRRY
jgi:cyclohexanone monooxygenase